MNTTEPYLHELRSITINNPLFKLWVEYALTLSRDDALMMARNGLTHQTRALRSMVREAVGNRPDAPPTLFLKLEQLVQASLKSSAAMR